MMSCFSRKARYVVPCVPYKNPAIWILINIIMLIWTIVHLIDISRASTDINDRRTTAKWFMAWFFIAAYIWLVEAGLDVWYFYYFDDEKATFWQTTNIVLAMYHLLDSFYWCFRWAKGDPIDGPLWSLITYFLIYLCLIVLMAHRIDQEDKDDNKICLENDNGDNQKCDRNTKNKKSNNNDYDDDDNDGSDSDSDSDKEDYRYNYKFRFNQRSSNITFNSSIYTDDGSRSYREHDIEQPSSKPRNSKVVQFAM